MVSLFKKPKAPATPDYAALAEQQGEENRRSAEQTARLASPNESNPWGSINRTFDDKTGQWTYSTELSPELAGSFDSAMGRLKDAWGQGFDTSGMTERVTDVGGSNFSNYQIAPSDGGAKAPNRRDLNYDPGELPDLQSDRNLMFDPGQAPGYQEAVDFSNLGDRPDLDFSNLPELPGDFSADRDRIEDALYQRQTSRLDPEWQQRETALRDRLYSQGIREGNPAWTQAFDDFNRQRSAAYDDARSSSIAGAGTEQSRLFGMASSARSQVANEALAAAGFDLDARSQGVAEALSQGNFANAVTQLERAYGLDRQQATNLATQLEREYKMNLGQIEANYGLARQDAQNRATTMDRDYQQSLRNFGLSEQDAINRATQLQNASQSAGFDERLQNAILANTGRAAELDEAAFERNLPYNEMAALVGGVSPGAFGGPTVAPQVGSAPVFAAGQAQYQANYNRYAQEMNQLNEMWRAVGQAAGSAAAASDRRLKSDIEPIASLPSGLTVYRYKIFGMPDVGVMADEAAKVFPDAVFEGADGFLRVDYGRIH